MSYFLKILLKYSLFKSIIFSGNFDLIKDFKNEFSISKYTGESYKIDELTIEKIVIKDFMMLKIDSGYLFYGLCSNRELFENAEKYFISHNSESLFYNNSYKKIRSSKRRYFDVIRNYKVFYVLRPYGDKVHLSIRFEKISKK